MQFIEYKGYIYFSVSGGLKLLCQRDRQVLKPIPSDYFDNIFKGKYKAISNEYLIDDDESLLISNSKGSWNIDEPQLTNLFKNAISIKHSFFKTAILTKNKEVLTFENKDIANWIEMGNIKQELFDQLDLRIQKKLEDKNITKIEVGGFHTIALTSEGEIYTWGLNVEGALGDENLDIPKDSLYKLPFNEKMVDIAAAQDFGSACLSETGKVYIWGLSLTILQASKSSITTSGPNFLDFLPTIKKIISVSTYQLVLQGEDDNILVVTNGPAVLLTQNFSTFEKPVICKVLDDIIMVFTNEHKLYACICGDYQVEFPKILGLSETSENLILRPVPRNTEIGKLLIEAMQEEYLTIKEEKYISRLKSNLFKLQLNSTKKDATFSFASQEEDVGRERKRRKL